MVFSAVNCITDATTDILRVELRGVCLVQSEELETDKVGTGLQAGRDGGSPLERIHDLAVTPSTIVDGTAQETSLVDLEPFQSTAGV